MIMMLQLIVMTMAIVKVLLVAIVMIIMELLLVMTMVIVKVILVTIKAAHRLTGKMRLTKPTAIVVGLLPN